MHWKQKKLISMELTIMDTIKYNYTGACFLTVWSNYHTVKQQKLVTYKKKFFGKTAKVVETMKTFMLKEHVGICSIPAYFFISLGSGSLLTGITLTRVTSLFEYILFA